MLLRALSRLWTEHRLPASPGLRWAAAGLRLLSSGTKGLCEQTLVAVKPDGVQRRLVGEIIQRFERRGFQLVGLKLVQAPQDILSAHYHDLAEKPFYPALIEYMSSGPIIAMVWEGHDVVKVSRTMVGATSPGEALPGTIRGDLCVHISRYEDNEHLTLPLEMVTRSQSCTHQCCSLSLGEHTQDGESWTARSTPTLLPDTLWLNFSFNISKPIQQ